MSVTQQQQQHSYVQSSWKDALNSIDFRFRRNVRYDDRDLTDVGNEFQARAAATGNARSPDVARHDGGTIRLDVDPDRRRGVIPCLTSDAVSQRRMMVRCHEGSDKSGRTDETEFAPEPVTSGVRGAMASRALISWLSTQLVQLN